MGTSKTPLRYPGGKHKIWRFLSEVLSVNGLVGGHYVEPFAGGAGVAMELLLNGTVSCVHLNDSCRAVYSFWYSVLHMPEDMSRRVRNASLTVDEWRRQRDIYRRPSQQSRLDLGFAMLYLNRCNRSGILNGGLIGGLEQRGQWKMDARFPRNELIARMERIASKKSAIRLRNWDAEQYLTSYVPKLPKESLVYYDPPYFHKADRLYANHYTPADHKRLAVIIQKRLKAYWLVSYDNAPDVLKLYENRRRFTYSLQYNAAHAYKGTEIFVVSDCLVLPRDSAVPTISMALKSVPGQVLA